MFYFKPAPASVALLNLIFLFANVAAEALSEASTRGVGKWIALANLPEPRQEHSTVGIGRDKIAVVGGVTARMNGTIQLGLATTNLVQIYSIKSDSWSTVAPTPYKVNHANVAALGGKVYLLGGLVDVQNSTRVGVDWVASPECHIYDPLTNSWSPLKPMPPGTERGSAIVAVNDEMIYLAGGMTVLNSGYQDSATMVTAFNTTSGAWQRLPAIAANIPEGRQHGVGSIVGDVFYVMGGRWFSQAAVRGEVFMLDLTNQTAGWKTSADRMPIPRGGLAGGVIRNQFISFGGEGNPTSASGVFNVTEGLDIQAQRWTELTAMAVPRHGISAAVVNDKIYVPGGGLQQDGRPFTINGVTSFVHTSNHFDVFSF